jgi:hypothetical protein
MSKPLPDSNRKPPGYRTLLPLSLLASVAGFGVHAASTDVHRPEEGLCKSRANGGSPRCWKPTGELEVTIEGGRLFQMGGAAANTVAPYGNLVRLAALTGLRQGELFALRDRDVDLEALTIQVERGACQGALMPVKTRASRRRVDLSNTAVRVLRRQLLARRPNDRGLVFPSPGGQILNDDNIRHRVFRPAVRRTTLTSYRFHDLRHTYAALMIAAGAHPKYLQAQMGHSSIRVTLDLYGHLFPDANRGVLHALDALTAPSTPHRAKSPTITPKAKVPRYQGPRRRERRDSNPRPPA